MENVRLETLIKNRKDLIEVHERNNMTDGFKRLLTELYPDEAHFIYELLQNAEDMHATEVRFILEHDHIEFEHNGTKRDFNIDDIDAITNIGNNPQKRDDPTALGKFGVGFKAVFAYTNTPEIHSGDYHFRIRDYFVPEIENVPIRKTNGYTIFSFPFDNPKKQEVAFEEVKKSLEEIDENSLLFLRYIEKIEYMLPSGELGFVERKSISDNIIEISAKHPNYNKGKTSHWLRFQSIWKLQDKEHAISIAFALISDEKAKSKYRIVPVDGKVYIYFPAEKETSNLKFHINAPFASTVARDSVRNCNENKQIIEHIGKLVAESLEYIKNLEMLTMAFLSVMPIADDNVPPTYQYIVSSIKSAFIEKPYTLVKAGGYDAARNLLQAPASISNLFSDADIEYILQKHKRWSANAPQNNQREDRFLKSLSIEEFGYTALSQMFIDINNRIKIEKLVSKKDDNWIKQLYVLLYDTCDRNDVDYNFKKKLIQELRKIKLILTTKGRFVSPLEAYIVQVNVSVPTKNLSVVKRALFEGKDRASVNAFNFLTTVLEIEEYNAQTSIELKLKEYEKNGITADKQYFEEILSFARFNKSNGASSLFNHYNFLIHKTNNQLFWTLPSQLILGKRYIDNALENIAPIIGKKLLWSGYAENYTEKELEVFVSFCRNIGLEYNIEIKRGRATDFGNSYSPLHPLYYQKLSHSGRNTGNGENIDYRIEHLEKMLGLNSVEVNKMIWQATTHCRYSITTARYSPNGTARVNSCESSIVYYLKRHKWIPNKQGVFCAPQEMTKDDLRDDFPYNNENGFLDAIEFGLNLKIRQGEVAKVISEKGINPESEEAKNLVEFAGFSKEKQAELLKAAKDAEKLKNNETFSPLDAFEKENKEYKGNTDDQSNEISPIQNKARREKKLEEEFVLGLKTPLQINKRLKYTCLTASNDEKRVVYSFYSGKCQMCDKRIIKHDNKAHFHAINIISTTLLDEKYNSTLKSGWNTISLCPNCAAEYRYSGGKNISVLIDQLNEIEIEQDNDNFIEMHILLNGKDRVIKFSPKHLLALQVVLRKSKES